MLKLLLFAFILYKTSEAYVGVYPIDEKPAQFAVQEGCYLSSLGKVLKSGIPYSPEDGTTCEEYTCRGAEVFFSGCGVKAVSEGCSRIPGNLSLPYPDCCERVRCMQPDGTFIEY